VTRVLVIDNYDSFVYTLNGYLRELGAETDVVRNDDVAVADLPAKLAEYDAVLVSPGPGKPADAGVSIPVVEQALRTGQPLLGVCLGHQAIAEAFGGVVTNAEELMHGKTSQVTHDDSALFDGVAQPFTATRYLSLAVVDGTLPEDLHVTARTEVFAACDATLALVRGEHVWRSNALVQQALRPLLQRTRTLRAKKYA